jgi:transcription elongation GreA/GreB family factor
LEASIEAFGKLDARAFGADEPIDVGALVELEHRGERSFYFIGPRAGGTEVEHENQEVLVITPQSPLGAQLHGRKQGERLQLSLGGARNHYRIATVA